MLEALGDDEARFLRRAAFQERDRAGLLDAVDVGLGEHTAHLAVEVFQARDDEDGVGQAVGDLDQVAHGLLEALLGVVEEAQVLDLVDAEDERGAVDRPHQRAECGDDLEGAVLARVGVERRHCLMCQRGELAPVEVLAHALVDARIAALQIQQRAHDVDVEALRGVLRARRRSDRRASARASTSLPSSSVASRSSSRSFSATTAASSTRRLVRRASALSPERSGS